MPNATDQPTDRPKRGTLFVLVLAAAIAGGLWYFLDRSKAPISPESTEATSDAAPATGDAGTTGIDAPPTADSGTAASEGNVQATEAGTAKPTDVAESTGAGAATQGEQPDAVETDTAGATGTTPTTDPATTAQGQQPDAAGTDTAGATGMTPTTDPAAIAQGEQPATAGADTADATPTTDPTATARGEQPDAAGTDTAGATGMTPTTDPAAIAQGEQPGAAGTDAAGATGTTPTTDPAATAQGEQPGAVETDTAVAGATTQTAEPGTSAASETTRTAAADAGDPTDATPATDSDPTLDPRPSMTAESGAAHSDGELVLAPAPEDTIEKTPVEAPSATETTGSADILASVDRAIERIEAAIKERLGTESEADSDTDLDVRVTYDDAQEDAAQAEAESNVAATTTEPGTSLSTRDSEAPESGAAAAAGMDMVKNLAGDAQTPDSGVAAGTDMDEVPAGDAQTPESGVAADTDITESAEPDAAAPTDATRTADSDSTETETEAKEFVETLTDTAPDTIAVDKADHFVTQERVISLVPEDTIESVSVEELAKDEALSSDTPITVVREVEQIEPAVPEQLIAESRGDLDTRLRVQVTYDDSEDEAQQSDSGQTPADPPTVEQITVREALERIATEPKKPLSIVKTVRYFEVMTLRELLDNETGDAAYLKVVTKPYRIESATLADLLQRERAENPDSIFYLHTVQPTDEQGIWGIVHFGLIENFAGGMAIRRGEEVGTYTVRIPRDADERLEDRSSSFLGKLIDRKTKESFVYNYRDNRMGRNPDRIFPGQELVIIRFDPEELMGIYTHFTTG